jgi:hypothetical protein
MKLGRTSSAIAVTCAAAAACSLASWPLWRALFAVCAARSDPSDICVVTTGFEDGFYVWAPRLGTAVIAFAVAAWAMRRAPSRRMQITVVGLVAFLGAALWLPPPYFPSYIELGSTIFGASISLGVYLWGSRLSPDTSLERPRAK